MERVGKYYGKSQGFKKVCNDETTTKVKGNNETKVVNKAKEKVEIMPRKERATFKDLVFFRNKPISFVPSIFGSFYIFRPSLTFTSMSKKEAYHIFLAHGKK